MRRNAWGFHPRRDRSPDDTGCPVRWVNRRMDGVKLRFASSVSPDDADATAAELAAVPALIETLEAARVALTFYRGYVDRLTNAREAYPHGIDVERRASSLLATLPTGRDDA